MSDEGHIFISYVREDTEMVDELAAVLRSEGALLWLDRESIEPGQRWEDAMRRAIEEGNFFLACFSQNWMLKQRSVMNEELLIAVDEMKKLQYGTVWFLPVKLTPCIIPAIPIGAGQTLHNLPWVNLYSDWKKGVAQIAETTLGLKKKERSRS